jgi:hypothetical protein
MTDEDIRYKAFLVIYKVLGQVRPNISFEERFLTAITLTSDDRWGRAKRLNWRKIQQFKGVLQKTVFSDALKRRF